MKQRERQQIDDAMQYHVSNQMKIHLNIVKIMTGVKKENELGTRYEICITRQRICTIFIII